MVTLPWWAWIVVIAWAVIQTVRNRGLRHAIEFLVRKNDDLEGRLWDGYLAGVAEQDVSDGHLEEVAMQGILGRMRERLQRIGPVYSLKSNRYLTCCDRSVVSALANVVATTATGAPLVCHIGAVLFDECVRLSWSGRLGAVLRLRPIVLAPTPCDALLTGLEELDEIIQRATACELADGRLNQAGYLDPAGSPIVFAVPCAPDEGSLVAGFFNAVCFMASAPSLAVIEMMPPISSGAVELLGQSISGSASSVRADQLFGPPADPRREEG